MLPPPPQKSEDVVVYKVYRSRFVMMAIYGLLTISNGVMWATFVSINDVSVSFFNVTSARVNMLALIFSILYLPGSVLGVLVSKKYGLRENLLLGGVLTTFGAFLRMIGCALIGSIGGHGAFGFCLFGQMFASIGYPLFYNMPATISADWFPMEERDLAASIAVIFSVLGGSIGQVISPSVATTTSDGSTHGMTLLMGIDFLICLIPTILVYLYFHSKPPTPPSRSTEVKDNNNKQANEGGDSTNTSEVFSTHTNEVISTIQNVMNNPLNNNDSYNTQSDSDVIRPSNNDSVVIPALHSSESMKTSIYTTVKLDLQLKEFTMKDVHYVQQACVALYHNRSYQLLFISSCLYLGMFNSWSIVLNTIISQEGYSDKDVGWISILYCIGIISSIIIGKILDITHKYKEILISGFWCTLIAVILFYCLLIPNNFIALLLSGGIIGLFQLAMLPAIVENVAECTYPIQEDISLGFLWVGVNILTIPITFLLQYFLTIPKFGPSPDSIADIFPILLVFISCIVLFLYKGDYKRLHCDEERRTCSSMSGSLFEDF